MKATVSFLLCMVSLCHFAAAGTPDNERKVWEARIKKVTPGMRREDVEHLLPPYHPPASAFSGGTFIGGILVPYSTIAGTINGGSQAIAYYVAPGWRVCICYDYTGVPRDASGRATDYSSPDNRVIGPVTLEYRLEPTTAPKKTP